MSAKAVQTAPLPKLAEIADELGSLEKEYGVLVAPFEGKMRRLELLRKMIRDLCPAPAAVRWVAVGKRFDVELGPKANARKVDLFKLLKLVGVKLFLQVASVSLTALEEKVKPETIALVVTEDRTGTRSIKILEHGA